MARKFISCSIDGCNTSHYGKGLCRKHYTSLRKHGDPLKVTGNTPSGEVQNYLRSAVLPYEGDECLIWPYNRYNNGYGQMWFGGKMCTVHRVVCEAVHGVPLPPADHAAHSCGNGRRGCVNPKHLSWKTPAENMADKIFHGTSTRGEKHNMVKLTEAQVREIISLKGKEVQRDIASRFGVSRAAISCIHRGKSWAWLD